MYDIGADAGLHRTLLRYTTPQKGACVVLEVSHIPAHGKSPKAMSLVCLRLHQGEVPYNFCCTGVLPALHAKYRKSSISKDSNLELHGQQEAEELPSYDDATANSKQARKHLSQVYAYSSHVWHTLPDTLIVLGFC